MRKLGYFCARTIGNIQLSRDVYPFMKLLTSRRVLLINPPVVREAEAEEEEKSCDGGRGESILTVAGGLWTFALLISRLSFRATNSTSAGS